MKKIFLYIFTIGVFSAIAQLFFPWWVIILIALFVSLIFRLDKKISFLGAFIALFLLWGGYSCYLDLSYQTHMGELIVGLLGVQLPGLIAYLISGLVAGISGGLGALIGSLVTDNYS